MNITNFMQATSLNTVAAGAKTALSTSIGKWSGIILGTSLIGLAAYHSYRLSQDNDADEFVVDADLERVKVRIQSVYQYVIGGLATISMTAIVAHTAGISRHILMNSYYCVPVLGITMIGSIFATVLIDKENTKAKHVALATLYGSMGLMYSTLGYLQGNVIAQAAAVTMLFGGAATYYVHHARNKDFIWLEAPLMTALTTISIASSIAFFFPQTAFAYGIDRVSLYGGLLIFSALFMASTQRLIKEAESLSNSQFDPINSSLHIVLDLANIFVRLVRIFNENQKKEENFV